ncbi:MAG: aminodeoxychorismate/anthranilate synthase component II [Hyphomonadaceae bacterium]|nr:aminodeoxychorismate/anthranilate synthase component II [Clostridia bacterium]
MILIIDNYDSFTYNLYQYFGEINPNIEVVRNDKITVEEVLAKNPSHLVISPGPGFPNSAGICIDLIRKASGQFPILGICLGHQAITEAFGGKVVHAPRLMHGKADVVNIQTDSPLFQGLSEKLEVGRYHSLIAQNNSLPDTLNVIASTEQDEIMAVSHTQHNTFGIQFHPESILTPRGKEIIQNFLKLKGGRAR